MRTNKQEELLRVFGNRDLATIVSMVESSVVNHGMLIKGSSAILLGEVITDNLLVTILYHTIYTKKLMMIPLILLIL